MYRAYENPVTLEAELSEKKRQYDEFILANRRRMNSGHPDAERLWEIALDMHNDIEELKERVNFAWQDDEFNQTCAA